MVKLVSRSLNIIIVQLLLYLQRMTKLFLHISETRSNEGLPQRISEELGTLQQHMNLISSVSMARISKTTL